MRPMQRYGLQPHDCTGTLTVNPQTLHIYNDGETYEPGQLTISNMTAEDMIVKTTSHLNNVPIGWNPLNEICAIWTSRRSMFFWNNLDKN